MKATQVPKIVKAMINLEDIIDRKNNIFQRIVSHRKNIKLLLDFATGYKQHARYKFSHKHFVGCDLRLISTIKNLHLQSRELHKEYKLLDKMQKRCEERNHEKN